MAAISTGIFDDWDSLMKVGDIACQKCFDSFMFIEDGLHSTENCPCAKNIDMILKKRVSKKIATLCGIFATLDDHYQSWSDLIVFRKFDIFRLLMARCGSWNASHKFEVANFDFFDEIDESYKSLVDKKSDYLKCEKMSFYTPSPFHALPSMYAYVAARKTQLIGGQCYWSANEYCKW